MSDRQEYLFTALLFMVMAQVTDGWRSAPFAVVALFYWVLCWREQVREREGTRRG